MRRVLFLLFFIGVATYSSVFAQAPKHIPLMNKYWDLLSTRTIKKNATGNYEPYFPPPLMALNGTVITLPGYIVPLKTAALHKTFLLSVLPIMQCQFCGEGDIPEMLEVMMDTPVKFSNKPITIKGKLKINENPDGATFQLLNGVVAK
ncbi:hypothetical protein [Pedobacter glucosidilyticus]|uniref:hypothetical protein n=1 Tax=Pedobacter glucosidilyticus TaxID=1122941 RepID=UPI0026EEDBBC|nr:hypothetical protein [Pedobacter glucosidilyticus]